MPNMDKETIAFLAGLLLLIFGVIVICASTFKFGVKEMTASVRMRQAALKVAIGILVLILGLVLMFPFLDGLLKSANLISSSKDSLFGFTKLAPLYQGKTDLPLPKPDVVGQPFFLSVWIKGDSYDYRAIFAAGQYPYSPLQNEFESVTKTPMEVRFYDSFNLGRPTLKITNDGKLEVTGQWKQGFTIRYGVIFPQATVWPKE